MVLTPRIRCHQHHLGDPVNSGRGLSVLVQSGLTNVCSAAVISSCPARLGCFVPDTFLSDGCSISPGVPGFRCTKARWNGVTVSASDIFYQINTFYEKLWRHESQTKVWTEIIYKIHNNKVHVSYIMQFYFHRNLILPYVHRLFFCEFLDFFFF